MWYAVVEKATGRLYATSTVIADLVPLAFKVIELGEDFVEEGKVWDVPTQSFVQEESIAVRDYKAGMARIAAILGLSELTKLTMTQKTTLKTKLMTYLGVKEA